MQEKAMDVRKHVVCVINNQCNKIKVRYRVRQWY